MMCRVCRSLGRQGLVCLAALVHLTIIAGPQIALGEGRCLPSAHRGERGPAFDNSLEAIRAAKGLPYVEIDVRITFENELILFHDRRLSATNTVGVSQGIGRRIESLSRSELTSIRFPDGSKIAKLRSALYEAEKLGLTLMLDVKSTSQRDFRRVMEEVVQANAESRVIVQCQTQGLVEFMRREFAEVAVLARAHHEDQVGPLLELSPHFVQIDHTANLTVLVPLIHERGARVVVKTLSHETDVPVMWRKLCDAGVDILLTDKPREVLAASHTEGNR